MVLVCSVNGCNSNINNSELARHGLIKFHNFPSRENALYNNWVYFCDKPNWEPIAKVSKICSLHFTAADYKSTPSGPILVNTACPTRYMENGIQKKREVLESTIHENGKHRNVVILTESVLEGKKVVESSTNSVHIKIEHEPEMDIYGLLPVNRFVNEKNSDFVVLNENKTQKISEIEENIIKKSILVVKDKETEKVFKVKNNTNIKGMGFQRDSEQEECTNTFALTSVPTHILALRRELKKLQQKVRRRKKEIDHYHALINAIAEKKRFIKRI